MDILWKLCDYKLYLFGTFNVHFVNLVFLYVFVLWDKFVFVGSSLYISRFLVLFAKYFDLCCTQQFEIMMMMEMMLIRWWCDENDDNDMAMIMMMMKLDCDALTWF